jgi:hypothetical protein
MPWESFIIVMLARSGLKWRAWASRANEVSARRKIKRVNLYSLTTPHGPFQPLHRCITITHLTSDEDLFQAKQAKHVSQNVETLLY